MKLRFVLAINALCAILLGWLYGGDALDAIRAQSAQVSAYSEPPNLPLAVVALAAMAVGAGASVLGVLKRREKTWRGFRLMPIVAVVVLFVDLFVLAGSKALLSSADRTAMTVRAFAEQASTAATAQQVPDDLAQLQALAKTLGRPPYLVKGAAAREWTVQVREGCSGPVEQLNGEAVATLFYCVAVDRKSAWVSAVGLAAETRFGEPALFTRRGQVVSAQVHTSAVAGAAEEEEPDEEAQMGEGSWLSPADSGER
jgi:hypothetical protein